MAEPAYRDEYERTGKHICPETGTDLTDWEAASVIAHAENLYPDYARKENFGDEAKRRYNLLLKIAKEKS